MILYNYADYLGPAVVKAFERKYGVDVRVSTFNDTDEAIQKIRTGARLATIGREYEEAARDLGASPMQAQRRVILPMLAPAILASAVLVFADVIDDFVLVRYLSGDSSTEPTSVKIYNTARAAPTPALNALATLMLITAMLAVMLGFLIYRWIARRSGGDVGIDSFAGEA